MMREAWTLSAALTAEEAMDSSLDMTGGPARPLGVPRLPLLPCPFGERPAHIHVQTCLGVKTHLLTDIM